MLKEKYVGAFLPDGWMFNGYMYLDADAHTQINHPNFEGVIKHFIDTENALIGDYNREVQKEWRNDLLKYENKQ